MIYPKRTFLIAREHTVSEIHPSTAPSSPVRYLIHMHLRVDENHFSPVREAALPVSTPGVSGARVNRKMPGRGE